MDTSTTRLEHCFASVFPEVSRECLRLATDQTIPRWDSLAHITLLSLIGEEFGISVELSDFADAFSFAEIHKRLDAYLAKSKQ